MLRASSPATASSIAPKASPTLTATRARTSWAAMPMLSECMPALYRRHASLCVRKSKGFRCRCDLLQEIEDCGAVVLVHHVIQQVPAPGEDLQLRPGDGLHQGLREV